MERGNPFLYRAPVPYTHFIGREQAIGKCRSWLDGAVSGGGIAISGEHGIGKTSLLHYLMHIAQQQGWGDADTRAIYVFLNCQTIQPFTPTQFWRRVLEELEQKQLKRGLRRQMVALQNEPELDAIHIQQLLRELHKHRLSLTLWLDSFTWVVKCDTSGATMVSGFLAGLRSLVTRLDHPLTLVTATPQPLGVLCADITRRYRGSDLPNALKSLPLKPFTPDEIKALLDRAQDQSGLKLEDADISFLLVIAGAHPTLLQMAGYHLYEVRPQGPLGDDDQVAVISDFENEAGVLFKLFWDESSPLERALLGLVILSQMLEKTSQPIRPSREVIYALLNKYEPDLRQLADRGHVRETEGAFQIASVVYARWIAHKVALKGEDLLAEQEKTIRDETLRQAWGTLIDLAPRITLNRKKSDLEMTTPPSPDSELPLPLRFELEDEIGRGAIGVVYRVYDTKLERTVAVKRLHDSVAGDTENSRDRLLKEARAVCKLQHPNIVIVHDATEMGGDVCIVMEYLEGQTLADYLHKRGCLPLEEVIDLVEQAADALDYAHSQGVIHRDIKPANLIFTDTGVLKLTDFGIAKRVGRPGTTEEGEIKGTVTYMSPEQVNEKEIDGRSDLFSLATVAFEMLSGNLPWPGRSLFDIMDSIRDAKIRPLTDFGVPDAASLGPIFGKALAKDPHERYQTGATFVQALKGATGPPSEEQTLLETRRLSDERILIEPQPVSEKHTGDKPSVFISYSHKDEEWKDRLVAHLGVLKLEDKIDLWADHRIEVGEEWREEIREAMDAAEVAILLVSADFLASKFIQDEEAPRLLERQAQEGLYIFPVLIRPCYWRRVKWLAGLQFRPKYGRPLLAMSEHEIEDVLAKIAEDVATVIDAAASQQGERVLL